MDSREPQTTKDETASLESKLAALTVDLQRKNRELEIQAALDVVRIRTSAMRTSSELAETSAILFKQLEELQINPIRTGVGIFDDEQNAMELWVTTYAENKEVIRVLDYFSLYLHPVFENTIPGRQQNKPYVLTVLKGDQVKQFYQVTSTYLAGSRLPQYNSKEYFYSFFFAQGTINVVTLEALTEDECNIIIRFAQLFGLTYARFLDLKNAEAQTYEARIESSLERVRTQAMSMNKPGDLLAIAQSVFFELKSLGFDEIRNALINTFDDEHGVFIDYDYSDFSAGNITSIKYNSHPIIEKHLSRIRQSADAFVETVINEEELESWKKARIDRGELHDPRLNDIEVLYYYFYSTGPAAIGISTFSSITNEKREVLKRFRNVFDLAYRRFADITHAELQARNSQIDAGLERVRATSMAMHQSNDLMEVSKVLAEQLLLLGLKFDTVSFAKTYDHGWDIWISTNEKPYPTKIYIPYFKHPIFDEANLAIVDNERYFIRTYTREEKNSFFKYFFENTDARHMPEERKQYVYNGKGFLRAIFPCKNIWLSVANYDCLPYTDEEIAMLLRFVTVFEHSYTRFLDLQKAEERAREARIETALERVRARTMGMQRSDELQEVVGVLYKQFEELDFGLYQVLVSIFDLKQNRIEWWSRSFIDVDLPQRTYIPVVDHPFPNRIMEKWKAGEECYEHIFEGKMKESWEDYLFTKTDLGKFPDEVKNAMRGIDRVYMSDIFMKYGSLQAAGPAPLPADKVEILKRFTKVLDLAYTRMIDLQNAEEQAKESKIQLALERVRARTMAMQHSDELKDAAALLFQQAKALGVPAYSCGYNIWEKDEKEFTSWMSTQDGSDFNAVPNIPLTEDANFIRFNESRQNGEQFFVLELRDERMQEHYGYLKTIPAFKAYFDYATSVGFDLPKTQIHHIANFSQGNLLFITLEPCPEFHDVFKRFAAVFEQTYTRFLDLQKAEAQAREAQIEASLERVRAKSMAMHKSEDLLVVVKTLGEQIKLLGFKFDSVNFNTDYREKDYNLWLYNSESAMYPGKIHIPYIDHPCFNRVLEAIEKGVDFASFIFTKEEKDSFFDHIYTNSVAKYGSEERKRYTYASAGMAMSVAITKNISLTLTNYRAEPFSEDENAILRRLSNVFEQSYTRFLDLQKAESQARENQIQLALERVRARTMAMHKSEELSETATLLFEQLKELGEEPERTAIGIVNEKEHVLEVWATQHGGQQMNLLFKFTIDEPHVMQKVYRTWKEKKKSIAIDLQGKELEEYYQFLKNCGVPVNHEAFTTRRVEHFASFSKGMLVIITTEPRSPEAIELYERFASVFDLTYTRFLDLQRAEAQARESQVQLALERVRARTMAMQRSDELSDATYVLFQQLKELGQTAAQISIGIIKIDEGYVELSATLHGNQLLQTYRLPLDEQWVTQKIINAWKEKQKSLTLILEGDELKNYNDWRNSILEKKVDFKETRWIVNVVFFSRGMLSFSSSEQISPEAFELLERFAGVFDQTYRRFLDLQKAEAQAKESQIEAALERVRSRAMAMQGSNELGALIGTVFSELTKLDLVLTRSVLWIMDAKTNDTTWWMANSEDPDNPISCSIQYHEHEPYLKFIEQWKNRALRFEYELKGEVKKEWDEFLFHETGLKILPEKVKEGMKAPDRVLLSASFNNFGGMNVASLEPLSEEHFNILLRFARVFDLTYTRFNDLKQAEAQTREAQIELALERVRARTMAMHRSEELAETAQVMFYQLQDLGEMPDRISIGVVNEKEENVRFWTTDQSGSHINFSFTARLSERTVISKTYKAWKENKKSLTIELQGDDLNEWVRFAREEMGIPVQDKKIKGRRVHNLAFFSHGWILVTTHEPQSEETTQILERFASVFNLTYRRFLDLERAEAQAREAEIEASLERVRSKTMAMHNSQEVGVTVASMFDELLKLGVDKTTRCGIAIFINPEKIELWTAFIGEEGITLNIGYLDTNMHPLVTGNINAWMNKEPGFTYILEGEDLINYYKGLNNAPEYHVQIDLSTLPSRMIHNNFYFSEGSLFAFARQPLTPEETQLFKRFSAIFGQTYRRYLDLQKAEAQAREAQIETALEKVRARTMGMQRSDELPQAASLLFEQIQLLKMPAFAAGYCIWDEDKQAITLWMSSEGILQPPFKAPTTEDELFIQMRKGYEDGKSLHVVEMGGEDLVTHYKYMRTLPVVGEIFNAIIRAGHSLPVFQVMHQAYFSKGFLLFITYEPVPQAHDIFKRFATVFDQTYTRFLDLQKAEAQAKESQIEAGLERVRARTMAMHSSEDVSTATATMFAELEKLGIDNIRGGITIIKPDQTQEVWGINNLPEGRAIRSIGVFDMRLHPLWREIFQSKENNDDFGYYWLAGKDKEDYIAILNSTPNYLKQPIKDFPDVHVQTYLFGEGGIWTNSLQSHTNEQKQIMKRFASVFSLTFRRYLDLQKAEAQAREAQIEAGLERVRAKAMAMHNSQDLADTIGVFYKELKSFSITPRRCGVGLLDQEERIGELFTWNTTEQGESLELVGRLKMEGHPVLEGVYDHWKSQTEYHPILRGNEIREYYKVIRPQMSFPDYEHDQAQYGYFFFFKEGGVYAWTEKEMKEEELQIYRRFTSVLSLTYKRYKDLKQAEASTKEALRQASLDRVRAEIASMRTVQDLQRITPVIWNELTTLSVPFIRCGIFIMDDEQKLAHTFLSTPDGKAIASFHLPYDTPGNIGTVISNWRHKEQYVDHWDESEFYQFAEILVKQGAMASPENYLKAIPHGGFYLHFLPFLQGMLYVGNIERLDEQQIELIQHVADAFSTAYARYEDFNKLELAKKEVESTLSDLKQAQQQLVQSEKMASLGELTAGIAHEIQNPLNFVNNFSDVSNELLIEMKQELEKGNYEDALSIAEDVKQNLEKIHHHGKRADGIVKGMLQHSRSSSGQKELTDINMLADEYLRLAYHGLRAKDKSFNAKFETRLDDTIGKINIIPQDIGRVILNLINNAFYAVSEKRRQNLNGYEPTVTVTTSKVEDKIELRVIDNGSGIPQKVLDKIFQPFFTTKPTGQGTGLGLSLSYDIITKGHGGNLGVETKEGEGTIFIIQLPAK